MLKLRTFGPWMWFKPTHCVSYSTKIDTFLFDNLTSKKTGTTCYLITVLKLGIIGHWRLIKQTHCVRYYTEIDTVMFWYFTNDKIRHYVLDNLLYSSCVVLAIENRFKQTHCGSYSTKNGKYLFIFWLVKREDTMC